MDETTDATSVAESLGVVETQETFNQVQGQTRLLSENAIPIPEIMGTIVGERFDDALKFASKYHTDWVASIDEFKNTGSLEDYATTGQPKENYLRLVIQSLIEQTYMQNPTAEFSASSNENQPAAQLLTELITTLVNKRTAPGLNLRPLMQRNIVNGHFTNFGVVKLVFTEKVGSQNDALLLYEAAQQELLKKGLPEEEQRVKYELLDRMFQELQNRQPFGLRVKVLSPFHVLPDPEGTMDDFSDHRFLFEIDPIDEDFIRSEYMVYDEEQQKYFFKYDRNVAYDDKSRSVNNKATIAEDILNKIMPDIANDERRIVAKNKVPCVWYYDRALRKYVLYMMNRWDTPLWVYEDTLALSRFYPYFLLSFSIAEAGVFRKSEPSFYIPFQRENNITINQYCMVRDAAFSTVIYDTEAIDGKEVAKVLGEVQKRTSKLRSIGVKLKNPDKSLEDVLTPMKMPIAQMAELFQDTRFAQAIDRTSRLNEAMRGNQFKTNTTNDAIDVYQDVANTRISLLSAQIEEFASQLFWAIAEVVISRFDKATITTLVGTEKAAAWQNLPVEQFNQQMSLELEAGSSEKPTSTNKKKEAVQIIQMLGQFGTAAPRTVLGIVTRLLRTVFSRRLVSDQDLATLEAEGQAAMQKGVSTTQPQGQA